LRPKIHPNRKGRTVLGSIQLRIEIHRNFLYICRLCTSSPVRSDPVDFDLHTHLSLAALQQGVIFVRGKWKSNEGDLRFNSSSF
jgi:hypothetical protein